MSKPSTAIGPGQRRVIGWMWHAAAAIAGAATLHGLTRLSVEAPVPLLGPIGFVVFALPIALYLQGQRHFAASAEAALASDPRPPVVYLRSFAGEAAIATSEQALARVLGALGPFVAIGSPGDTLPPLGASRAYQPLPDWQTFATRLVSRSQLVAMLAGATPGLGWEIGLVRGQLAPERLIVLVPRDQGQYAAFRTLAAAQGLMLPAPPPQHADMQPRGTIVALITFDRAWQPQFVWRHYGVLGAVSRLDAETRALHLELCDALRDRGVVLPEPETRVGEVLQQNWRLVVVGVAALAMARLAQAQPW